MLNDKQRKSLIKLEKYLKSVLIIELFFGIDTDLTWTIESFEVINNEIQKWFNSSTYQGKSGIVDTNDSYRDSCGM